VNVIHIKPQTITDYIAFGLVKFFRLFADAFFKKRYGNRAVILETIAAVPGMVGAGLLHFRCLRRIQDDAGWIHHLLEEADNERMHLMTFIEVARPTWIERLLVVFAQGIFVTLYLIMYLMSSKMAHRFVGYLEEEAVSSYTYYLQEIDNGHLPNVPAPKIAIDYWKLPTNATLRDVVLVVRDDEAHHRDVNHYLAAQISKGKAFKDPMPKNM
jgi:ubiquinol oxidase